MTWFKQLLSGEHFGMSLKARAEIEPSVWNQTVDDNPNGSWWHRYEWLDYCLAYKGGTDFSFAAIFNGKIVALYPLIQEGTQLSLGGNPAVPALIRRESAPDGIMEMAMMMGMKLCNVVALRNGVTTAEMMLPITSQGPLPAEATFSEPDRETEAVDFRTRVIDLRLPVEERWKAVRKSYHQLIRRGRELHALFHHTHAVGLDHEAFDEYHGLHRTVFGDVRPVETYEKQRTFLKNGLAHLYVAREKGGQPVGATLWYVYKNLAYYASGVYAQDNVAHFMLWDSMHDLAARGVVYAELGWQGRATDEKGKAIEFLKRGFGGEDWRVPCLRRTFLTHRQEAAS